MKAIVHDGRPHVSVSNVADPTIERLTDYEHVDARDYDLDEIVLNPAA